MTVAEYAEKGEDLGPLVNDSGADLVVVSMPRETYELVQATLQSEVSHLAFCPDDRERCEQISDALDQMNDITDTIAQVMSRMADGLSLLNGALCLAEEEA